VDKQLEWKERFDLSDKRIGLLTRYVAELEKELEGKQGLELVKLEMELMDAEQTLKAQHHYRKSMEQDKEQQEKVALGKRKLVMEHSKDILRRARNVDEKHPAYPAIKNEYNKLGKPGCENGDEDWIEALFNINQFLKH